MYVCVRKRCGHICISGSSCMEVRERETWTHVHKWQSLYRGQRTTVGSHFSPSPCSDKVTFFGSAVLCTVGGLLSPFPTLPGITDMCACI